MSRVFSMKVRVMGREPLTASLSASAARWHSLDTETVGESMSFDARRFIVPADFEAPVGTELTLVLGLDPLSGAPEIQTSICGNDSTGSQAGPHPELTADPAGGHPPPPT